MNNQKLLSLLTLSTVVFIPISAQADESSLGLDFTGNASLVTEYVFRGITQSNENPAIQGGFDVSHDSGIYAGVWGSNVNFNDGDEANVEIDVYGGYEGSYKGLTYDIGAIYYAYPGADDNLNYDFVEGYLGLSYDFDLLSASASFNYSPDYFGESGDAQYYALGVDVPLPKDFTLSGHIGYQAIDDNASFGVPDYTDWSVGLGYTIQGFDVSLQYIDTDLKEPSECADGCDTRIVFGISRSF